MRTGGIMPESNTTAIVYTTSEFTTITGTSGTTNKGNPKISCSNNLWVTSNEWQKFGKLLYSIVCIVKAILIINFKERDYCIELTPLGNRGNKVLIFKDLTVIDSTPAFFAFDKPHKTCFNSIDVEKDIIELRHEGGSNAVTISIKLINKGHAQQLYFGPSADKIGIAIDGNNFQCSEKGHHVPGHVPDIGEVAFSVEIQNGTIIRSQCVGSWQFMIIQNQSHSISTSTLVPKAINYPQ